LEIHKRKIVCSAGKNAAANISIHVLETVEKCSKMGELQGFPILSHRQSYIKCMTLEIPLPVSVLPWVRVGPAVGCRQCRPPARPPAPCPGSSGSAASRPATTYFFNFKGIVSRDEYFLKDFKILNSTF
jgi:hypothetical protein